MTSLHMYELYFFGAFILLIIFIALPKVTKLLRAHDSKQKKEYSKLQSMRTTHFEEYKKAELSAKFAEQRWRKFTTHQSKLLKISTEKEEQEQSRLKLAEVTRYEERSLADLVLAKRKEILREVLGRIQAEFVTLVQDNEISFDSQITEIGKHFTKNPSINEE